MQDNNNSAMWEPGEIIYQAGDIPKEAYLILEGYVNIETKDGYMEEVRFIALEKNKIIGAPEPARIVLKHENLQRFRSHTYTGPKKNYGV